MWNGKLKAITFSFDDGVKQDIRAIEIMNKYGLKGTFNLNSGKMGENIILSSNTQHYKINAKDIKSVYDGHEVAVHTLTHPLLTNMDKDGIIWQVEKDREILSDLCGYEVIGMAYPCGGVNNDDRVAEVIKNNTGVKYARTITNTHNFDLQDNYYRFNPTIPANSPDCFEIAKKFVSLKTDKPQLFYAWGHTYEFDGTYVNWQQFEEFCQLISNRDDIFYGTNKEVLF